MKEIPMVQYPQIDMEMTGRRIKKLVGKSGYSVKQIQQYLGLSCPQPIYRWFKGQILPSLDHLYALGLLFHIHMEDILVSKVEGKIARKMENTDNIRVKRFLSYYRKFCKAA